MSIIYMMKGLPASGKSTYIKSAMMNPDLKRVSKDDLRAMLDLGEYSAENEVLVLDIRDSIINRCVEKGFNIVVDDTNFNPAHEQALRRMAKVLEADFNVVEMKASLETCLEWDSKRDCPVGEFAIRSMAEKYLE